MKVLEKIDKMYRQMLTLTLVLFMSVLLVASLVFLALYSPSVQKDSTQAKSNVSYVLVNEDTGATFNGQPYNLGNDFVTLINQDTQDSWQNASLSVANAGLKSGAYDVEIVLPQNFSKCLLSLQSTTPEQANITYKVKSGESQLANASIQQKVGNILNSFNQRIVQMYFSSILGNLYAAQRNVGSITYGQQNTLTSLQNTVYTPFHNLPNDFSSIVTNAQALQSQNQSWQDQQNAFTSQTQSLLNSTADSLNQNLSILSNYNSLQQSIANANLQDAQLSVNTQSANDYSFYQNLYNNFNTNVNNWMSQIYQPSEDPENPTASAPDVYNFQQTINSLQTAQNSKLSDLQQQINQLNGQAQSVSDLRGKIAEDYFANAQFDPTTATQTDLDNQTKQGLKNLITSVTYQGNFPQIYLNTLNNSLSQLDDTDLHTILDMLHTNNVITGSEYTNYLNELKLVEKYAKDSNVSLNKEVTLNYITATNGSYPDSSTYTLNGKYTFDVGKTYQLILTPSGSNLVYDSSTLASIESDLTSALASAGLNYTPTVTAIGGNIFNISFSPVVTTPSSSSSSSSTTSSSSSTTSSSTSASSTPASSAPATPSTPVNTSFTASFGTLDVDWNFSGTEKATSYNQAPYTLELLDLSDLKTVTSVSGQLSAYFDLASNNDVLVNDLKNLLPQFQTLDQGANQIVSIFGTPTDTVSSLYNVLTALYPNATFPNLPQSGYASSVYYSYGNLTDIEKEDLITSSLLQNYEQQGVDLWTKANDHYNALEDIINTGQNGTESLQQIYNTFPNLSTMQNEASALLTWAENAQTSIAQSYAQWSQAPTLTLSTEETDQAPPVQPNIIWYNTNTGQQVVQNFTDLINSSQQEAIATANSQQNITSISDQFQALSQQTTQIQNDTNSVLDNVNQVAQQVSNQTSSNTEFLQEFSNVMANARVGGANNQQVFNFLANPVNYMGTVGKIYQPNLIPYFMTLIGFLLSVAVGNGVRLIEKRRQQKVSEQLVVPTRIWLNTPTVGKTALIAVIMGAVFGISSQIITNAKNGLAWDSYVFLLLLIGIFFATYLFRQLPKLSLYLLGGLLGLYLILTPFLGITIKPGSFVNWLFRVSPLQNIENGYQALIGGAIIGWLSYLVLFLILVVCVALNFTVKTKKMKEESHD